MSVGFSLKAVPEDANKGVVDQLPNLRGREGATIKWFCIHALGPSRAIAILEIEQIALRNALRMRGETSLRSPESISFQFVKKLEKLLDTLDAYQKRQPLQEHVPDFVDVVDQLSAVLFYIGQDFLTSLSADALRERAVSTLNEHAHNYCERVGLPENEAWECCWRKYDGRSFRPTDWRANHRHEAEQVERELQQAILLRYGPAERFAHFWEP